MRFVPSIQKVRMCNSGTEATMSAIRLARGFTKRDKIIKFAGCYHGHSDSLLIKAGSGALTHGHPDSAGVPAAFAQETIVLPFNDAAALEAAFAANPGQIAAVILEPYPANVGLILPEPGFLQYVRALCTAHGARADLRRGDDRLPARPGRRPGDREDNARPDDAGQDHRRRPAGRRIRRPRRDHGSAGPARSGLPGRHPERQSARHGGRNRRAETAGGIDPYARLDRLGCQVQNALLAAARKKGLPLQVPQIGSMFAVFFTATAVRDYATALTSDAKLVRPVLPRLPRHAASICRRAPTRPPF